MSVFLTEEYNVMVKSEELILVNDQRDAQILLYVFISIHNSLHVSST